MSVVTLTLSNDLSFQPRLTPRRGFPYEKFMKFRRVHSQYDRVEGRAYVEARAPDAYGGEMIVSLIFSYRPTSKLTDKQREQEIKRQAHYALKAAADVFSE